MWWGLAAAASIGLAALAVWRPATDSSLIDAPVQVAVAPTEATAPSAPRKGPESVVAVAPPGPAAVVRPAAPVTVVAATGVSAEPPLEVITNQVGVLRQLWADYRDRPLVMAESESVVEGLSAKPIAVEPIAVRPIVVSEIGKESGPAGATPIIRRADATKETR